MNPILRPFRSATGPAITRLASATKLKIPIATPNVRSVAPRSCRTYGPNTGMIAPIPMNPRNVEPATIQKSTLNPFTLYLLICCNS